MPKSQYHLQIAATTGRSALSLHTRTYRSVILTNMQQCIVTRRAAPRGVTCAQGALKLCQQALVKYPDHQLLKVLRAIGLDRSGKKEESLQVIGVRGATHSLLGCRGCTRRTGARELGLSGVQLFLAEHMPGHGVTWKVPLALPFALQTPASSTPTNNDHGFFAPRQVVEEVLARRPPPTDEQVRRPMGHSYWVSARTLRLFVGSTLSLASVC